MSAGAWQGGPGCLQGQQGSTGQFPSYQSGPNQPASAETNIVLPSFLTHSVLQSGRWCLLIECELRLRQLHKPLRYYPYRNTSIRVY